MIEDEKDMTDEQIKERSKVRMKEAMKALENMFAVARMGSDHEGHRLAFALMEDAMKQGSKMKQAKERYADGTSEAQRRDAAGIIQLMQVMTDKMSDLLAQESGKMADSFAKKFDEDSYSCGDPNCPIHGTNAVQKGDILRPDQLTMLPPAIAAGFGELIKQGLVIRHVGASGPIGAISMHGPKHLLEAADKIMASAGTHIAVSGDGTVQLPQGIEAVLGQEPQDAHTKEISDALDRALGKDRTHLPKKDIPLS